MDSRLKLARDIIAALPQRKFMRNEDIARWLEQKMDTEPHRIVWLAQRLSGFGGSDIGVLVADMRNKQSDDTTQIHTFKSARDVVSDKLLRSLPNSQDEMADSADLQRGIIGESFLVDRFIEHLQDVHQAEVTIDSDSHTLMKSKINNPQLTWLNHNIDLALLINNEHRMLADIKWPRSGRAQQMQHQVDFTYACQLHHYNLASKNLMHPVHFDSMVIAAFDSDTFQFYPGKVSFDPTLEKDIISAGSTYWSDYVLKGQLPDFPKKRQPVGSALKLPDDIQALVKKGLALKSMEKVVSDELTQNTKLLNQEMTRLKGPKQAYSLSMGIGSVTSKVKYHFDFSALSLLAKRAGLMTSTDTIKDNAAAKALFTKLSKCEQVTEHELLTVSAPDQNFITGLTRKQTGDAKQLLEAAKASAKRNLDRHTAGIQEVTSTMDSTIDNAIARETQFAENKVAVTDSEISISEAGSDQEEAREVEDTFSFFKI